MFLIMSVNNVAICSIVFRLLLSTIHLFHLGCEERPILDSTILKPGLTISGPPDTNTPNTTRLRLTGVPLRGAHVVDPRFASTSNRFAICWLTNLSPRDLLAQDPCLLDF